MEEVVDVPAFFLCPISLQMMRDPVTLPTGITYDRESIERWTFTDRHHTCPVTKQSLGWDMEITPNHTLRRLIQSWCASKGVERFPTPRAPVDKVTISTMLHDISRERKNRVSSLRKLRDVVVSSDQNKRCAEKAGAADVLLSVIRQISSSSSSSSSSSTRPSKTQTGEEGEETEHGDDESMNTACDEALNILNSLQISDENLRILVTNNYDVISLLTQALKNSNHQSRSYATVLLKSISRVTSELGNSKIDDQFFVEIVRVIHDRISNSVTKAALCVLVETTCQWGRNRVKMVNAGGVKVLIELLLDGPATNKRMCEMIMVVLNQLCGCAEGREEFLRHGAGIAVVAKKIVRVSELVTDRGVRILHSIVMKSSAVATSASLLKEMMEVGVVTKLCLVLYVECGVKTKEKAREILCLHSRVWKDSPCIAPSFRSLYPQ